MVDMGKNDKNYFGCSNISKRYLKILKQMQ